MTVRRDLEYKLEWAETQIQQNLKKREKAQQRFGAEMEMLRLSDEDLQVEIADLKVAITALPKDES